MRYLILQLNENATIEIENDLTGKETIKYNGVIVSSQRSFFGSKHEFTVNELGTDVKYNIRIFISMFTGVGFTIFRNGSLIMSNKVLKKSKTSSIQIYTSIVVLFISGYMVGNGFAGANYKQGFLGLAILGLVFGSSLIKKFFPKTDTK